MRTLGLVVSLLLAGCGQAADYVVDDGIFAVPRDHDLADSGVAVFPGLAKGASAASRGAAETGEEGFSFVLNPGGQLDDQVMVQVTARDRFCRVGLGQSGPVDLVACATRPVAWRGRRLNRTGDATFWTYDLAQENGAGAPLINCYALVDHHSRGHCTANLPHEGLVLTFHLNDSDVAQLAGNYDRAVRLLAAWRRSVRAAPAS